MKSKHIGRIFSILLVLCLGIPVLFAVYWYVVLATAPPSMVGEVALIYQPAPTPGNDLHMLEVDAEIIIPASAREIHGLVSGFRELDTWVRLDLPAGELSNFLQNARCTGPLKTVDPNHYHRGKLDPEWWQPHTAILLEECIGQHDFLFQRVLVDRSKSEIVRVYVYSITQSYIKP